MPGFLEGLVSAWRQPAVKTSERYDSETQGRVPWIKITGTMACSCLALAALWVISLTIPPNYVKEASLILGFSVAAIFALLGLWRAFKEKLLDRPIHVDFAAYALLSGVLIGGIFFFWSRINISDWWFQWIDPRILSLIRIVAVSILLGSLIGDYWWVKELIVPFELTGLDRVLMKALETYLPTAMEKELGLSVNTEQLREILDGLRSEINERLLEIRREGLLPLRVEDTETAKLNLALQMWHIDVYAFLAIAILKEQWSRHAWVDDRDPDEYVALPSGLVVGDAEHRAFIKALTDSHLVRTVRNQAPRLRRFEPEEMIGEVVRTTFPKELSDSYSS